MKKYPGKVFAVLASVFLTLSAVQSSMAASITETVRAGKTTRIYAFGVFSVDNCKISIAPRLKAKKFKNGKISSRHGSFVVKSGRCKGKRIRSIDAYYTPNPGFRGVDKFRFCYAYDRFDGSPMPPSAHCVRATLTVK